jgi:hypothetical protein
MDVRAAISIIAVLALTAGFFLGRVEGEIYVPAMVAAIAWWYSTASKEAKLRSEITDLQVKLKKCSDLETNNTTKS